MSKTVTLTESDAKLVMQALDHAVKSGGLNAAAAILPVAQTIEQQLTSSSDPSVAFAEGPSRQGSAV